MASPLCILVTGPASSGKSEWAEQAAHDTGQPVTYIATAQRLPDDPEWQAKIERHRDRRPAHWHTEHIPVTLPAYLTAQTQADHCYLIDSLGTWLASWLEADDREWFGQVEQLIAAVQNCEGTLIFVAEEVGWGLVPVYPLGRIFRDRLGALVRRLSPCCAAVYLITGGYALDLVKLGTPLPPLEESPELR
ncbi:bifunctional adenosylcobinamide kinase/adenosylcobinamide-phosphate guanylyltransferase [Spirulina major CS-329]|uniref:bifunctional adenosylcobinamide kinase/adenosylcobinamide-phosphate guanylyltransferase n=1 Tax=Spirulina TaxID=1154 RepID=UPI00232C2733|nr:MULTISPECIES: bifunctional adenosylcobinamide kinase/adenosylcobinamide-phosphate guanylyltransferase [Spirulina]MDB9493247.1 bifunctional adenosylcobinamide kinase/adenosylcobinamide-phosphate guanylyltransferase [Spirulina subsalsa CS-330]MDB9503327.1 bifunctional adenosylcobinamide kinase/adenosylcobinamide-phosphate guanylyltransferase [Spirulina major CS-329]